MRHKSSANHKEKFFNSKTPFKGQSLTLKISITLKPLVEFRNSNGSIGLEFNFLFYLCKFKLDKFNYAALRGENEYSGDKIRNFANINTCWTTVQCLSAQYRSIKD